MNGKKNWANKNNEHIYNNMPPEIFRKIAIQGGLSNNCDLKAIAHYVKPAKSILEVGAGYGRVLSHIIQYYEHKEKLCAMERNKNLDDCLETKFEQVEIINTDLRSFNVKFKFDLILWMWGGINEF